MIALNEIISNKDKFEQKYKAMGKKIKLDKIISLEQEFIKLDKKVNELRSTCNKYCGEIAEIINSETNPNETISKINTLDKEIIMLEKKSSKAMKKINKRLSKLPNLPLNENVLNLSIKTTPTNFSKNDLIDYFNEIATIEPANKCERSFISSLKKVVFKSESLPKTIMFSSSKKQNYLLICGSNALEILNNIQKLLTDNAKYLIEKSIKSLKKESSKELFATLSDETSVLVKFSGEFVSRENNIKLYDKNLDMTKFVNFIMISIK